MKFFEMLFGQKQNAVDPILEAKGQNIANIDSGEADQGGLIEIRKPPLGWKSPESLRIKMGKRVTTVSVTAEKYRQDHPEWFAKHWSTRLKTEIEYYHPDLIKKIEEDLDIKSKNEKLETAVYPPQNWKTAIALKSAFKNGANAITRAAEKYRSDHPEWFGLYWSTIKSENVEYYAPELIAKLEIDLGVKEKLLVHERLGSAPKEWRTDHSLANSWGHHHETVAAAAEKYKESHPEWFKEYASPRSNAGMIHYHPDLVVQLGADLKVSDKILLRKDAEKPPNGWRTPKALQAPWFKKKKDILAAADKYREDHPEWFHIYWSGQLGDSTEFLHPDLINKLKIDLGIEEIIKTRELATKAPKGWRTEGAIAADWVLGTSTISNATEKYRADHPEWFGQYWSTVLKSNTEHYHPDLIKNLEEDLKIKEKFSREDIGKLAPVGWRTPEWLFGQHNTHRDFFTKLANPHREGHPEWFDVYQVKKFGPLVEHYHPTLVKLLENSPELIARLTEREASGKAPEDWKTASAITAQWKGISKPSVIAATAEKYREDHPEWFGSYWSKRLGSRTEYFHPELIGRIEKDLDMEKRKAKKESAPVAPVGWRTPKAIAAEWHGFDGTVSKIGEKYRADHPEWFKMYWSFFLATETEHYHPDLIERVKEDYNEYKAQRDGKKIESRTQEELKLFLKEISENISELSKNFRELIKVFGSSRCVDVLFQFRPEYKVLKHDYVKGLISEYLGDCLNISCGVPPDRKNILLVVEQLSNPDLREGLYEAIKDDCYHYLLNQQRADPLKDRLGATAEYKNHLRSRSGATDNVVFNEIVDRVIKYYTDLWKSYDKPPQFVDALKAGREFPDINQRINIKELEDKKRLVIADEMGVGKSASVIMAKEHLGLKCALVVVPSNVVQTWKNYLSDVKEGGYFKPGQAPKILVVESVEQLQGVQEAGYDYVLISHERLTDRYADGLLEIPYDMLIVDEYHKLKSLKGVRSEKLLRLAQKIDKQEPKEGEAASEESEKYLALLSGTPVPNKVQDIAISLKLLYPERFGKTDDSQLVLQILKGDVLNLRSLLLPRLQMKSLRDAVEMPPLTEELIEIEAGELEKEIYGVFLEDDELASTEKLSLLRQFTLSPWTTESTPGFKGAKIERVGEDIRNAFETKNRVLLFVDDFVENVIRGEHTIMQEFNLPPDVVVRVVHGGISTEERNAIQAEFQDRTNPQKIFLIVSGQTADVGVDYSAAEEVFHYNEPWTKYRKLQELGRAYRPGLAQPLHARTYITKGTIEEGMYEYILQKYRAVEKLVRGIPLSQLEQQLLQEDEKRDDSGLEVNADLAAYYFSNWDRMMQFFGHTKELGEENFRSFVETHGKEYARGYSELGVRSYQANANRVSGTVMHQMIRGGRPQLEEIKILDVASGPEMLKRHIDERYQDKITSVDINPYHFMEGESEQRVVGSWTALPFEARSFNYVNLSLAIDQASFIPSKGKTERIEVLKELNRVLKVGGKAVMSMIYSVDFKDNAGFHSALSKLGFKAVDEFCGEVSSGTRYNSRLIVLEKMDDVEIESEEKVAGEDLLALLDVKEREGMKLVQKEAKIRDTRKVLTSFEINGRKEKIQLNELDRLVLAEEEDIVVQGENLKKLYTRIEAIPPKLILENGFVRIKVGDKYVLFKKLKRASGVVVIK